MATDGLNSPQPSGPQAGDLPAGPSKCALADAKSRSRPSPRGRRLSGRRPTSPELLSETATGAWAAGPGPGPDLGSPANWTPAREDLATQRWAEEDRDRSWRALAIAAARFAGRQRRRGRLPGCRWCYRGSLRPIGRSRNGRRRCDHCRAVFSQDPQTRDWLLIERPLTSKTPTTPTKSIRPVRPACSTHFRVPAAAATASGPRPRAGVEPANRPVPLIKGGATCTRLSDQ